MYVHDLIETLKYTPAYNGDPVEDEKFKINKLSDQLQSAETYYFGDISRIIDIANKEHNFDLSDFGTILKVPFKNVNFEGFYNISILNKVYKTKFCISLTDYGNYHEMRPCFHLDRFHELDEARWAVQAYSIILNPTFDIENTKEGPFKRDYLVIQIKKDRIYIVIPLITFTTQDEVDNFTKSKDAEKIRKTIPTTLMFLETMLRILACKNIIVEKINPPAKLNKKRIAKNKQPILPYNIFKVTRNGIKTKGGQITLETKELTHCPGHFKTYTSEAPLFGKHVDTWWWSPWIKEGFESQYRERQVEYKP